MRSETIMESLIMLNDSSMGRDKIARLAQFTSRIVWHQLELRYADKYSIDRMRNLEATLASFRKILRLGRCVDVCYSALSSMHIEDPWLRHTITISRIARSIFLFADHIVWLSRGGLLRYDSNDWDKTANKFWVISIMANLARDFYEIYHILDLNSTSLNRKKLPSLTCLNADCVRNMFALMSCHKDIFVDTLKNSCDLFIPLTYLGYSKMSPSTVGLLGAVSSIAGLITIVKPLTKLVP